MFRWLKNRKEKKERRRQDKHKKILSALKSKDTSGSNKDYGFYKDDFMFKCVTENKPHDYEEIDDVSVFPPQFTGIIGSNFTFGTSPDMEEQPPQLPARIFSSTTRSISASACQVVTNEERRKHRTVSLPCFERSKQNCLDISDACEEPHYNEPWDCRSDLTVQCDADAIHLRLYEKIDGKLAAEEKEFDSRWSRISLEHKIYSEIEDSDTGCESDAISQTGSVCSLFATGIKDAPNIRGLKTTLESLNCYKEEASDSDASSGFCDEHSEIDEEHKIHLLKSLGNPEKRISSPSLFRYSTYPRSPCSKIYEDSELYLIPKSRCRLDKNKTGNQLTPVQKKKYLLERRGLTGTRNRILNDIILKNNFQQHYGFL